METIKAKILKTIHKYSMILPNEKIILGISGGPDSLALLYLLVSLKDEIKCNLHLAHLNHKLRDKESDEDARYVIEHAKKLNLPITVETMDVRNMIRQGESLESGSRRIRYEFFERIVDEIKADKVALGHNADDQAETVLMHFLRGSGTQGLGGIPPIRDNKYIRPLIEITRTEIDEYLKDNNIIPRIDSSNQSLDYQRNKIRLELIPLLEKEYKPNLRRILCHTGQILRPEDELLNSLVMGIIEDCIIEKSSKKIILRISKISKNHIALKRRIIRWAIKTLIGDLYGYNFEHIESVIDLADNYVTGSEISLPRSICVEKSYDALIFKYREKRVHSNFEYKISLPGVFEITELGLMIKAELSYIPQINKIKSKLQESFDFDKITNELHIRNRLPGDRFFPLGMKGCKKLQDFFVDEKVPKYLRDSIPILTCGNDIVWVVGYRIDERFKVTENTRVQLDVSVNYSRIDDYFC